MFVALLGQRRALHGVRRTLLGAAQSAVTDGLFDRGEALYVAHLQHPGQRRDRPHGGNACAHPVRCNTWVPWGSFLGVSESAHSLSSAFLHQALLLRPIHSNLPGVTTPEGSGSVDEGTVACRRQNLYNCPVTGWRVAASNSLCVVLRIIVASLLFSSALTAVEPNRRFRSGSARRRVSGLHNRTRA